MEPRVLRPPGAGAAWRPEAKRPSPRRWRSLRTCRILPALLAGLRISKCASCWRRQATRLPVEEIVKDLQQALREPPHAAVVVAPPGAGKTTALPLAVLEQADGIVVTEPRRMAARAAARRMAFLLGEEVGETVGFRTRYESCVSSRTKLEVVTDGLLARRLQADGALSSISTVLFDEFHERSLGNDMAFTLCLHAQSFRRKQGLPDLRMVAMSATLSDRVAQKLAELLGCRVLRSEGREFHVELEDRKQRRLMRVTKGFEKKAELTKVVVDGVLEALRWGDAESAGDVLCFLPGEPEIRRCQKQLEARFKRKPRPTAAVGRGFGASCAPRPTAVEVLPLHGGLDAEAQDRAVRPLGRSRRVILATNVAEASITVQGVTCVVDSGLRKRSIFDPSTGFNRLELAPVSAASADQRRGRAGRVRDGFCLRLWAADETLLPEDAPAIAEEDLTGCVLQLLAAGVEMKEISELRWLEPPPEKALDYAKQVLRSLNAVEEELTAHGRAMARLPLHPRLAHMVLMARPQEGDVIGSLASLCAILEEERDVLEDAQRRVGFCADVAARLQALEGVAPGYKGVSISSAASRRVLQNRQRLRRDVPTMSINSVGPLLALAFPERVARRGKKGRFVLRDGSICLVKDAKLQKEEFLAVARLFKNNVVTLAAPLSASEAAKHILDL